LREFSGFDQGDRLVMPRFRQRDRGFVADRAVRPFLIVVSTPSLQLFGRICKRQERVRIQLPGGKYALENLFRTFMVCLPYVLRNYEAN
jgi:hypothetical protein